MELGKKALKRWLFSIGKRAEIQPLEKGIKSPDYIPLVEIYKIDEL